MNSCPTSTYHRLRQIFLKCTRNSQSSGQWGSAPQWTPTVRICSAVDTYSEDLFRSGHLQWGSAPQWTPTVRICSAVDTYSEDLLRSGHLQWGTAPQWTPTVRNCSAVDTYSEDLPHSGHLHRNAVTQVDHWSSCNENQLDALFILSLFRQSTSTCFGYICSPSSGGILYIYIYIYIHIYIHTYCIYTYSQLKSITRTNCCIYTVYLLMVGYRHARNM